MILMRATAALCFLFLAGCAGAVQPPQQSIIRPRPRVLHINGTVKPVAFPLGRTAAMVPRHRWAQGQEKKASRRVSGVSGVFSCREAGPCAFRQQY
ncbi:MAG TPA: hypothetical protein VF006_28695 [Longimicrobium sp.]